MSPKVPFMSLMVLTTKVTSVTLGDISRLRKTPQVITQDPQLMPSRMAAIPTSNTRPERLLQASLRRLGAGPVATNVANLPGSPDAVLAAQRTAFFTHGCFWHNHPGCPSARLPNTSYPWAAKFSRNRQRDQASRDALLDAGWRVGWVWECALVGADAVPQAKLDKALHDLLKGNTKPFVELAGQGRPTTAPCQNRKTA